MGGIVYRQHELIKENHLILTQQLFFSTTDSEKKIYDAGNLYIRWGVTCTCYSNN